MKNPADRPSEAELRRRLAAGSQDAEDYGDLAARLTEAERTDEAIAIWELALALPLSEVGRAAVEVDLGWTLYYQTCQVDRALALARQSLARVAGASEAPEVLYVRGLAHSLIGDWLSGTDHEAAANAWRTALSTLDRLFREHPEWEAFEYLWLDAAGLHNALNDGAGAVALCRRHLQAHLSLPARVGALATLGEALRLTGRLAEAEEAVVEALACVGEQRGMRPHLCHLRGLICRAGGRPTDARESFERALAALDGHPLQNDARIVKTIRGNLAEVYTELGEHDKAAAAWRELLGWYADDDPARAWVLLSLGHAGYSAGALADARSAYEAVLAAPHASDEDRADAAIWALWTAGEFHYRAGEYAPATRAFESLLDHYRDDDPDRRKVLRWLGDCCYFLGDFAGARERYEEVLASPRVSDAERADFRDLADRSVARFLYDAGQYAEAADAFKRVLDRLSDDHPEWCGWLPWLGACYFQVGAYGAARDCYEEVLRAPQATEAEKTNARRGLDALRRDAG